MRLIRVMLIQQEYTTRLGVGIRIGAGKCQVIRKVKEEWQSLGPVYELPVEARLLSWAPPAIPPGVLAVALRAYESENPGTRLRSLLRIGAAAARRPVQTPPKAGRTRLEPDEPTPLAKVSGL
jgi:hypothetical protein